MTRGWQRDFDWQQKFAPEIKRIVGPYLLEGATLEQDQKEATDFAIVMKLSHESGSDFRLAARVRRAGYYRRYRGQVTIRSKRSNGAETEWSKVRGGWGDWFLYGHDAGDVTGNRLHPWVLVDLEVVRRIHGEIGDRLWVASDIPNGDGTFLNAMQPAVIMNMTRRFDLVIGHECGTLPPETCAACNRLVVARCAQHYTPPMLPFDVTTVDAEAVGRGKETG